MNLNLDKRDFGQYEILEEIGRGGMSTVYLARDQKFGRQVALKVLPPQFTHDPAFVIRFDKEARILASLEHHAIVPIYDYGEVDGWPYFAMRYMPGRSLKDKLADGLLPLDQVQTIARRICAALDKAHQRSIIHRDVKPGNILFDTEGLSYLGDFGIARLAEVTRTVTMAGTPEYMTPEQIRNETPDHRSDIYQMGVVLFELLSGRLPFTGESVAALFYQHIQDPIPSIGDINPALPQECAAVVERAMAKNPADRFDSAGALSDALEQALVAPATQESVLDGRQEEAVESATAPPEGPVGAEAAGQAEPGSVQTRESIEVMTVADRPSEQAAQRMGRSPGEEVIVDMTTVPVDRPRLTHAIGGREGSKFVGLWLLVSFLVWLLSYALTRIGADYIENQPEIRSATWVYAVTSTLISASLGFGQWLLLRRSLGRVGWWIVATMSRILVMPITPILFLALDINPIEFTARSVFLRLLADGLVLGAFVGTMQWLVLRNKVLNAGWWVLAAIGAGLISALTGILGASTPLLWGIFGLALMSVLLSSLLQGSVMAWLLAHSDKRNIVADARTES